MKLAVVFTCWCHHRIVFFLTQQSSSFVWVLVSPEWCISYRGRERKDVGSSPQNQFRQTIDLYIAHGRGRIFWKNRHSARTHGLQGIVHQHWRILRWRWNIQSECQEYLTIFTCCVEEGSVSSFIISRQLRDNSSLRVQIIWLLNRIKNKQLHKAIINLEQLLM